MKQEIYDISYINRVHQLAHLSEINFLVSTWDNKIKRIVINEPIQTLTNYGNIHQHSTISLPKKGDSLITTSGFPARILRISF